MHEIKAASIDDGKDLDDRFPLTATSPARLLQQGQRTALRRTPGPRPRRRRPPVPRPTQPRPDARRPGPQHGRSGRQDRSLAVTGHLNSSLGGCQNWLYHYALWNSPRLNVISI